MVDKWLEQLKVGDLVIIGDDFMSRVLGFTKTMILTARGRYNRKTGRGVGSEYGFGIQEPTPELIDRIRHRNLVRRLVAFDWKSLPMDALRKVEGMIEAEVGSESGGLGR